MDPDRPFVPHQVHAPTIVELEEVRSYVDPGRPAEGIDAVGPYWTVTREARRAGMLACPDCGQDLVGAHDEAMARAGFPFLLCWDMAGPFGLFGVDLVACHEGCVLACGRES